MANGIIAASTVEMLSQAGTGTISIVTPATNTNRTLTVPDNSGTLISTATPGAILQVVQGTYSSLTTITSTAYQDTGLSVSITPSRASSKILVTVFQPYRVYSGGTNLRVKAALLRDATQIALTAGGLNQNGDGGTPVFTSQAVITYLDSPSTTSAITYKTMALIVTSGATSDWNGDQDAGALTSTITVMEIAA